MSIVIAACGGADGARTPGESTANATASAAPEPASSSSPSTTSAAVATPAPAEAKSKPEPPHFPLEARDFDLIRIEPTGGVGELCLVSKDVVRAPVAIVEMVYVKDGLVARRERWRYPWDGSKPVRQWSVDYEWNNGRLTKSGNTRYEYDADGRLAVMESTPGRHGGTQTRTELRWKGKRISKQASVAMPPLTSPTSPLPFRLPFQGTVTVERTEGGSINSSATVEYDGHGWLRRPGWKTGAAGEPVSEGANAWLWDGAKLVGRTWSMALAPGPNGVVTGRESYEYDATGRLVRLLRYQGERGGAEDLTSEVRYEHRCPGSHVEDAIWL